VRDTSVFQELIGVRELIVDKVKITDEEVLLAVRPRWRRPRCGECGRRARGYDRARKRTWRHLNLARRRLVLVYQPRRVECPRCQGVRVERVPWAEHDSGFTREFSVTIGEFRPFHLPFEHDELLAKNSVFCDQVFTAACDVGHGTRGKNGRFWFGELLESCFDLMEERFAGVDDSRKHDEVSSLVG
jgi:hypothetical protein